MRVFFIERRAVTVRKTFFLQHRSLFLFVVFARVTSAWAAARSVHGCISAMRTGTPTAKKEAFYFKNCMQLGPRDVLNWVQAGGYISTGQFFPNKFIPGRLSEWSRIWTGNMISEKRKIAKLCDKGCINLGVCTLFLLWLKPRLI